MNWYLRSSEAGLKLLIITILKLFLSKFWNTLGMEAYNNVFLASIFH